MFIANIDVWSYKKGRLMNAYIGGYFMVAPTGEQVRIWFEMVWEST